MLSDADIAAFHGTGWLLKPRLFEATEIERMRGCFEQLERLARDMPATGLREGSHFVLGERNGEQIIKRVVWAGGSQPYLLTIGEDERLTVPAAQLLGSSAMDQLLSQAHFKRPHDGVVFGWHQDIQHRDKGGDTWRDVNGKGSFVQTIIALDAMTPDSGPLQFIPGSSGWGRVDFGAGDYTASDAMSPRPAQFREEDAVTILAEPGDTLFFGPYTAHASFENTSSQYRRVLINGYAYPEANKRVYPGEGSGRRLTVSLPPATRLQP
ncbi:MAG: phytanoyl-CoA dioxygenase family protein [Pseudomonadota bacterium]